MVIFLIMISSTNSRSVSSSGLKSGTGFINGKGLSIIGGRVLITSSKFGGLKLMIGLGLGYFFFFFLIITSLFGFLCYG